MYDFSTRKNDRISYSGREERLERILVRYIELTDKFYNKEKLVRWLKPRNLYIEYFILISAFYSSRVKSCVVFFQEYK